MLKYINQNWSFKDFVDNIEVVKSETLDTIASFSSFEIKKQIKFKKQLRDKIYAFNFEIGKRERILEYIYDYFDLEELKKMCN